MHPKRLYSSTIGRRQLCVAAPGMQISFAKSTATTEIILPAHMLANPTFQFGMIAVSKVGGQSIVLESRQIL